MYDVAIVIPVYNGFRGVPGSTWLEDSIVSALHSDHPNFQVVIVDDGSNDGTLESIHALLNKNNLSKHTEVIPCAQNHGVSHALNVGILNSDARYIATQGSDDLCTPYRLPMQSKMLDDDPSLQMVGCFYWHCDSDGNLIMDVTDVKTDPFDIYCTLISGKCKIGSPMFRKSLWEELGGFDETNFPRCAEDFDFFLRTAERYRLGIGVVPHIVYGYRDTPNSVTKSNFFPDYFRALDMSRERRRNRHAAIRSGNSGSIANHP